MKPKEQINKEIEFIKKLRRINFKHNRKYNELMKKANNSWKDIFSGRYSKYYIKATETKQFHYQLQGYLEALYFVLEINEVENGQG